MSQKNLLSVLLLLCLVTNCGQKGEEWPKTAASTEPAYGDTLITGSIGDASTLMPPLATDSASGDIIGLVYNGLVKYDKDINLTGDLAESWEVSPDGLQITFHLRKGVRWHDGVEFSAADVLFTYQTMIDPKVPTAYEGDFLLVKNAQVLDKYTFRVTYDKPFAPALSSWGINMLPKHLLEGKDIVHSPLARQPIGTGPYKFKEWKTGEKVVLESNPDYFEGRPYIDRYLYRIIPDTATMFLELKAGTIDEMGLRPLQYLKQTEYPGFAQAFNKFRYPAFAYTYLGYNFLDERFQDKRVRQAISYAIDKKELIDGVLLGLGQIATGPYKPGAWYYNPNVNRYDFNQAKAKELLAQAGWKDSDNDGILDKGGKPFSFTIMTNQGNEERAKTAQIIQQRLSQIGIKVEIRIVEWAAFIKEFIHKKNFEAIILGWTVGHDPDIYDIWHSSKTAPGELNHISYKNAEVDALLDQGRHTFDREARKKAYFRLQEILADEQPYTFLYVPDALPVVSSRFHGIEPAPLGIGYNFIKWYVPKHLQRYAR
ncbi:MAG: peptide-binding protein [Candidatus Schekmanbacteria bacterium]|nr:peptide-binding protein [Candidatus Schekmanbacteria bacterium]